MSKHLISENDLELIVSVAKRLYATESFPIVISKRTLESDRLAHYFLAEALISYLNQKGLLNKEVRFDVTPK